MSAQEIPTATAPADQPVFTYDSDFVKTLVETDNSYPERKRDKLIREVYGTGAGLELVNGTHYRVHVTIY